MCKYRIQELNNMCMCWPDGNVINARDFRGEGLRYC